MDKIVVVTGANDLGADVLEVLGTVNGEAVRATGWVSAMTNFYPPEAYGEDGHRKAKAKPRAMTDAEKLVYMKSLLSPAELERVEPKAIDIPVDDAAGAPA